MKPVPVHDALLIFPGEVGHLMPPEDAIPDRYWDRDDSWSCKLFHDQFFVGVHNLKMRPRPGIDPEAAWRHIMAIMRTFSCQHEYKEAACRYLFDRWFETATWEPFT